MKQIYHISKKPIEHPEIINTTDTSLIAKLAQADLIAIDTENNSLDVNVAAPLLTSLSDGKRIIVVDNTTIDLKNALPVNSNTRFIGQNLVYDIAILMQQGIFLDKVWDLMVADQVYYRGDDTKKYDIVTIHERYLKYVPEHMNKDVRLEFAGMNPANPNFKDYHILYSGYDVEKLIDIYHLQVERLQRFKMLNYVTDTACPLLVPVAAMHLEGFILQKEALIDLIKLNEQRAFDAAVTLDKTVTKLRDSFFDLGEGNRHPHYYYLVGDKFTRTRWKHPQTQTLSLFDEFSSDQPTATKTNTGNINYASTTQLVDLFARLQLPLPVANERKEVEDYRAPEFVTVKDKKSGNKIVVDKEQYPFTTAKDAFEQMLIERPDHSGIELVEGIVKYRNYKHYVDSFGYNLLEKTYSDGKIRTLFRTETAVTGRFQSGGGKQQPSRINFQNIPRLKEFRKLFGVEPGYSVGTVDLSGAEVTIMCDKAHDEYLYEIAVKKDDAHSPIATIAWKNVFLYRLGKRYLLWNNSKEFFRLKDSIATRIVLEKDPEYQRILAFVIDKQNNVGLRTQFKAITFGIMYGAKPKKLAKVLNITVDEGEVVHGTVTRELAVTYAMVENNVRFALQNGYVFIDDVRTQTKVWFPEVIHALRNDLELPKSAFHKVDGGARNYPIQGTQALMVKEAIVDTYRGIPKSCALLSTIHDELVVKQPYNMDGVSNDWHSNPIGIPFTFDKVHDVNWIKDYLLHNEEEYDMHVLKHDGHNLTTSVPYFTKLTMMNAAWRYLRHYKMGADMQVADTWVK